MVSGWTIQYAARNMMGQDEQGMLEVSPDGMAIQGQISFSTFGTPMGARMIFFVRA